MEIPNNGQYIVLIPRGYKHPIYARVESFSGPPQNLLTVFANKTWVTNRLFDMFINLAEGSTGLRFDNVPLDAVKGVDWDDIQKSVSKHNPLWGADKVAAETNSMVALNHTWMREDVENKETARQRAVRIAAGRERLKRMKTLDDRHRDNAQRQPRKIFSSDDLGFTEGGQVKPPLLRIRAPGNGRYTPEFVFNDIVEVSNVPNYKDALFDMVIVIVGPTTTDGQVIRGIEVLDKKYAQVVEAGVVVGSKQAIAFYTRDFRNGNAKYDVVQWSDPRGELYIKHPELPPPKLRM